jgi:hypothetical protein
VSDPNARIFLLSHMRAYTSLAGYILGSHPQINGYYEMHLGYEEPAALDRQLAAFRHDEALKPGTRFKFARLRKLRVRVCSPDQTGRRDGFMPMVDCRRWNLR